MIGLVRQPGDSGPAGFIPWGRERYRAGHLTAAEWTGPHGRLRTHALCLLAADGNGHAGAELRARAYLERRSSRRHYSQDHPWPDGF